MLEILNGLAVQHDERLVGVAAGICILTVYTAFMTFGHARDDRATKNHLWLLITGLCASLGIWSAHFIAMLAYDSGIALTFDPIKTAFSFVIALAGMTWAFFLISSVDTIQANYSNPWKTLLSDNDSRRALLAGGVMGASISSMHFTGMLAIKTAGHLQWNIGLFIAAIIMGMLFCALSFRLRFVAIELVAKFGAPSVLIGAIGFMHFAAMAALQVVPDPKMPAPVIHFDNMSIALPIAALSTLLLFLGFAGSLHKTTEINKQLSAELAQKLVELQAAQDDIVRRGKMAQLGQLTATVAHELRNPLGAVRTSAFLLDRKLKGKGLGIEAQLERIDKGVLRCDSIISQLLDFARTKSGFLKAQNFDDWVAKIVTEEGGKLPEIVTINCALGLGDRLVSFDADRMSRVLINLLSNASEAMVGKGDALDKSIIGVPTITVETSIRDDMVELSVRDCGPGIGPENLSKILEPLFTTKTFGTGLGLPAVENILVQHGGGLTIESELGKGACFTARIPLVSREGQAEMAATPDKLAA